ncbi:BLUF domain-containing protein [Methylobacterium oryzihabitans]|uniref:BLUF domain-containing protein n=1 Tax=Methylobacterium oryzihabitans TaxID=2499852 RepID=A0A437NYB9_9HYPH|nr:BLUF domain-containing protein [Methylobacterium oryzihabitans]RVU14940.1 hypothetical protein EOE48_21195 [Methylobacterium oryzihabitans]
MTHQLVCFSRNAVPGSDRAMLTTMRKILSASQRNVSRDGITGFLVVDTTWFVQILEGERARVTESRRDHGQGGARCGARAQAAREGRDVGAPG